MPLEKFARHAQARAWAREVAAGGARLAALRVLINGVLDYDCRQAAIGGGGDLTLRSMRDRLRTGATSDGDRAFMDGLPREALATAGLTAEHLVDLIADGFDDGSYTRLGRA